MKRLLLAAVLFAGTAALAARAEPPAPPKPLVPSIAEIMQEAHQCRTAYIRQVRLELAKEEPDWGLVEGKSRELVRVGKLLALNTPPKGGRESWERITSLYVARATVLADAAGRRDKDEAAVVANRMGRMCSTCHQAHADW